MARSFLVAFLCLCTSLPALGSIQQKACVEVPSSSGSTSGKKAAPKEKSGEEGGKINVNTASASELTTLNGIGDATAKKIIAYRDENGPFKSIDDLTQVKGIGEKTLARFRDQITLGNGESGGSSRASPVKKTVSKEKSGEEGGKINVNTASASELTALNGIGDATAKKIIAYRDENGPFKSIDDLTQVKGIGEKTLARFRDQITLGDGKSSSSSKPPPKAPSDQSAPHGSKGSGEKININTAPASELEKLPGVGETTAKRIIEHREANGPFTSCQQLTNVKGIGEKTLQKLESMCAVK